MGNKLTRVANPLKREISKFDLENRTSKLLDRDKLVARPSAKYDHDVNALKQQRVEMPHIVKEINEKNENLLGRLKEVYVTSKGRNTDMETSPTHRHTPVVSTFVGQQSDSAIERATEEDASNVDDYEKWKVRTRDPFDEIFPRTRTNHEQFSKRYEQEKIDNIVDKLDSQKLLPNNKVSGSEGSDSPSKEVTKKTNAASRYSVETLSYILTRLNSRNVAKSSDGTAGNNEIASVREITEQYGFTPDQVSNFKQYNYIFAKTVVEHKPKVKSIKYSAYEQFLGNMDFEKKPGENEERWLQEMQSKSTKEVSKLPQTHSSIDGGKFSFFKNLKKQIKDGKS